MKTFVCYLCQKRLPSHPEFRIAFFGFVWNPENHQKPLDYYDICKGCYEIVLKHLRAARAEAMETADNDAGCGFCVSHEYQMELFRRLEKCQNKKKCKENLLNTQGRVHRVKQ